MSSAPGVLPSIKKDGTVYYRASITCRAHHISLGSFPTEQEAAKAYRLASCLLFECHHFLSDTLQEIEAYSEYGSAVSFDKWVMLLNFRDHPLYCRNPIYLQHRFFFYCLDPETLLKFDVDDLFFYMNHKIMRRGGHLFVADYGMQLNLLSRYGIKNYAVAGRDYLFANKDHNDFRYGNIEIVNRYYGVTRSVQKGKDVYTARIHVNGNTIIGRYDKEELAAIAYNKAVNYLRSHGIEKEFPENYIDTIDEVEYAQLYHRVKLSRHLVQLV